MRASLRRLVDRQGGVPVEGRGGGRFRALAGRLAKPLVSLALLIALSGCLVSVEPVELGRRAQPLEPGLYVSFQEDGAPEEAFVVTLDEEGIYRHDLFFLSFYESGLAPDLYFTVYTDREQGLTLYGVAEIEDGVATYPAILCDDAPAEVLQAQGVEPDSGPDGGCLLASPEQARAVLTAIWSAMPEDRERLRFVLQTEFRR